MTNAKQPIILGSPERERNPLRKLIAGFCNPFVPGNNDDEDETIASHEESPRNHATARGLPVEADGTTNNRPSVKARQNSCVRFEKLDINRSLNIPTQQKNTRNMSELTIDTHTESPATTPNHQHDPTNTPEFELAKSVVRQRRQHALSVFFASFIFVMAAMVTLQKLGYSIADFHAPIPSSSSGRPWIQFFDKTKVETGKISVKAKNVLSDTTTTSTSETTSSNGINEDGDPAGTIEKEDAGALDSTSGDASNAKNNNSAHSEDDTPDTKKSQATETQEL